MHFRWCCMLYVAWTISMKYQRLVTTTQSKRNWRQKRFLFLQSFSLAIELTQCATREAAAPQRKPANVGTVARTSMLRNIVFFLRSLGKSAQITWEQRLRTAAYGAHTAKLGDDERFDRWSASEVVFFVQLRESSCFVST